MRRSLALLALVAACGSSSPPPLPVEVDAAIVDAAGDSVVRHVEQLPPGATLHLDVPRGVSSVAFSSARWTAAPGHYSVALLSADGTTIASAVSPSQMALSAEVDGMNLTNDADQSEGALSLTVTMR